MDVKLNLASWFGNLHTAARASQPPAADSATAAGTAAQAAGASGFEPEATVLAAELVQRLALADEPLAPQSPKVVAIPDAIPDSRPELPTAGGGEAPGAVDETPAEDSPAARKSGVVRLLEAGHFKGVADARLRLNFFDQLDHEALPALTPPKGNGKAFAKFAEQYEGRRAASAPGAAPADLPHGDAARQPVDEAPAETAASAAI